MGDEGLLSESGTLASSPEQIEKLFVNLDSVHAHWDAQDPQGDRHLMLFAHGGLSEEDHALSVSQDNINWWLNNKVYPLFFIWQSGAFETSLDQLADELPAASGQDRFAFSLTDVLDQTVEDIARSSLHWMWAEMKENARAASAPVPDESLVAWPPTTPQQRAAMMAMPAATLTAIRLRRYLDTHPRTAVHLVGHSAGAIFHAGLLGRMGDHGIPVASVQFLAPALRVDEFLRDVLPTVQADGFVRDFATFDLSDQRERADVCAAGGLTFYHKSLLYLVSRALEDDNETPLLGMQKFFDQPGPDGVTLHDAIDRCGGISVFSPSLAPPDQRSQAAAHGGFSGDILTMTSVVMRVLGLTEPQPVNTYQSGAELNDPSIT